MSKSETTILRRLGLEPNQFKHGSVGISAIGEAWVVEATYFKVLTPAQLTALLAEEPEPDVPGGRPTLRRVGS